MVQLLANSAKQDSTVLKSLEQDALLILREPIIIVSWIHVILLIVLLELSTITMLRVLVRIANLVHQDTTVLLLILLEMVLNQQLKS